MDLNVTRPEVKFSGTELSSYFVFFADPHYFIILEREGREELFNFMFFIKLALLYIFITYFQIVE